MRMMNSYRLTIFLDVKTELAGFETEPNENERGSILYGCVNEPRYRQRLRWMRAYREEHDVCSSFPWRQLAQSWKVDAGYAQSMVIVIAEDAGQCVLGMDSSSAKSISVNSDEIRLRMCRKAVNAVKVTSTAETFRNVEDGMWRWTYSTDVVCSVLSCNWLVLRIFVTGKRILQI